MMTKIILLVTILFCTLSLESFVVLNDIVPAFPEKDRAGIESAVVEGTIHFLDAQAQTNLLLKEYEKSAKQGMDHAAALAYVDKALFHFQAALSEYGQSVTLASQAGYMSANIEKLKNFDHGAFAAQEGFSGAAAAKAGAYLAAGDILGAYRENIANIQAVVATLEQIREKLAAAETPAIELFWTLLRQSCKASLFGNCCTVTATAALK